MFDDYICYQIFNVNRLIKLTIIIQYCILQKFPFVWSPRRYKIQLLLLATNYLNALWWNLFKSDSFLRFADAPNCYTQNTQLTRIFMSNDKVTNSYTTKATLRNLCVFQNNSGLRDVTFVNCGLVYSKRMIIIICHNTQWSV